MTDWKQLRYIWANEDEIELWTQPPWEGDIRAPGREFENAALFAIMEGAKLIGVQIVSEGTVSFWNVEFKPSGIASVGIGSRSEGSTWAGVRVEQTVLPIRLLLDGPEVVTFEIGLVPDLNSIDSFCELTHTDDQWFVYFVEDRGVRRSSREVELPIPERVSSVFEFRMDLEGDVPYRVEIRSTQDEHDAIGTVPEVQSASGNVTAVFPGKVIDDALLVFENEMSKVSLLVAEGQVWGIEFTRLG